MLIKDFVKDLGQIYSMLRVCDESPFLKNLRERQEPLFGEEKVEAEKARGILTNIRYLAGELAAKKKRAGSI